MKSKSSRLSTLRLQPIHPFHTHSQAQATTNPTAPAVLPFYTSTSPVPHATFSAEIINSSRLNHSESMTHPELMHAVEDVLFWWRVHEVKVQQIVNRPLPIYTYQLL
jgi:hypothetical protein